MNELRQALPLHDSVSDNMSDDSDDMSERNSERSTASTSYAESQDSERTQDRAQDQDSRSEISSADSRAELSAAVADEADIEMETWEQEERDSDRAYSQTESLEMIAREQPDELEGWEIENAQDDDMGEIENIVRDRESGDLYALISSGGFIGFGESQAVIPLSELQKQADEDDELVFTGQDSEIQEYVESQYEAFTTETAQIEAREERRTEIASQSSR